MSPSIAPEIALTLLGLLLGALQYRKQGFETIAEREELVNSRLAGNMVKSDSWGIEYERIELTERNGVIYYFKKLLTGRLEGEAEVTIRYRNASIPGELWDSDFGRAILNGYPYGVEHIVTDSKANPTTAVFRIESVHADTIKNFSEAMLTFEEQNRETRAAV